MTKFDDNQINYQNFLLSINSLLKDGKLINQNGYFSIEQEVYKELHDNYIKEQKGYEKTAHKEGYRKKSAGRITAVPVRTSQILNNNRTFGPGGGFFNGNSGATNPAKKSVVASMKKPNSSGKSQGQTKLGKGSHRQLSKGSKSHIDSDVFKNVPQMYSLQLSDNNLIEPQSSHDQNQLNDGDIESSKNTFRWAIDSKRQGPPRKSWESYAPLIIPNK